MKMYHFRISFLVPLFIALMFPTSGRLLQAETPPSPPAGTSKIEGYQVTSNPANIGVTVATPIPGQKVEVFGQPRMTKGHPCTQWDQEDIDHMKEMLKTNKELQVLLENLKSEMDKVIAKPVDTPQPQKGADGQWLDPNTYFPNHKFGIRIYNDMGTVSNLGTLYALTGDAKYADYAKALLLSYAHFYEYGTVAGYNNRFAQGMTGQLLNDQILTYMGRGYDLIYNLPSWTAEERKQIHDEFFWPLAAEVLYPSWPENGGGNISFGTGANNRGALTSTGVLIVGYATDDQDMVNAALYGIKNTTSPPDFKQRITHSPLPQDWTPGTADNPYHGGLLANHFGTCIQDDGMWLEGSPSYTLYAGCGLITSAEVTWHHGIDLYRHDNCRLKRLFDSLPLLAYPDMTMPGFNDAFRFPLYGAYYSNTLYEYLYRRYHDPLYLALIFAPDERKYLKTLEGPATDITPPPAQTNDPSPPNPPVSMRSLAGNGVGCPPVSVLYDLDPQLAAGHLEHPDMNFFNVGFGILRTENNAGVNNLTLCYGPTVSHGHPDKLQIDLFAFGDVLMPSPGIQSPYYNNPQLENWYHETVAHNTLTVDEKEQAYYDNAKVTEKGPRADQLVYGPASTVGLERAWTNSVYPGVTMDRAVFLTQNYLADLFGALSDSPHKYDLAWHICGDVSSDLKFDPLTFPPPIAKGYNFMTNIRQSKVADKPFSLAATRNGHTARLYAAGSDATNVIIADGGLFVDMTSGAPHARPPCATILERRENLPSTLFGNALDISSDKDGYIKSVVQHGDLTKGYGLLKVETKVGTDLCFASYRTGNYKIDGLETDALQAFVQMNGSDVQTLYLGGGTKLAANGGSINRSAPGLAYIEKTPDGNYIVGNPSPADAGVTVKVPALNGLNAFTIDGKGESTGAASITQPNPGEISLQLPSNSRVEFTSSKL